MEIQGNTILVSLNDANDTFRWAVEFGDQQTAEWAALLVKSFPDFDEVDLDPDLNLVPVPNSPKVLKILESALQYRNDTREEDEDIFLRATGRRPAIETARDRARRISSAISSSHNVIRFPRG